MADKVEEGTWTKAPPKIQSRSETRKVADVSGKAGVESGGSTSGRASTVRGPAAAVADRPNGSRNLRKDLRDFASARPQGWSHDDWLNFLDSLKDRGHDIRDKDAIGVALEKERLDLALSRVKGVGPQRRQALVDRYGTIWSLRNADLDEIASIAKIPRNLAEGVKAELAN